MAKEPAERWQTARDLLAELEFVAEGGTETAAAAPVRVSTQRSLWLRRAALAAFALVAGAAAASASFYLRGGSVAEELRFRVPIQLTADTVVAGGRGNNSGALQGYQGVSGIAVFNPTHFAISPDGRTVAFVARQTNNTGPDGTWFLYTRPVGAVTPQRLAGTEGASQPFWSDDSGSIAFVAGGKLKRVEASGGPPQELCDAASFNGGTWNRDGVIVFGSAQGLQRVPAEGGKPTPLTRLAESESGHYWPHFLPDGHHYLYTVWSGQAANRAIVAGTIESPETKTRVL